eukprot:gnl/MRDRNA2_/MRDRNA2_120648_c0_seq1.p1 gnl/MRDRNA2_/MRDRNA2_120648_c0~~gnl/MRDRNA2_/MRDRNA2_120648_c0_seq1.p1  ORF type:complete len:525 (+),score=116.50 gnl/MRDRNA2_/MRDRNA2_120648_c0_seq1:69-1577(+)
MADNEPAEEGEQGQGEDDHGAGEAEAEDMNQDWLPGAGGQGEGADYFPDLSKAKRVRPDQIRAAAVLPDAQFLKTALQLRGNSSSNSSAGADGLTPLLAACQAGALKNVKMLTQVEEAEGSSGSEAALLFAVDSGNADVVRFLLSAGRGSVNARNKEGRTPLLLAAKDRQLEIVTVLSESPKLNPDARDNKGMTALHEAVGCNSLAMVDVILARGANPGLTNQKGWTPLHMAAQLGHIPIIDALVSHGCSIRDPAAPPEEAVAAAMAEGADGKGWKDPAEPVLPAVRTAMQPLHLGILGGHVQAVKRMIDMDADPTARGANEVTPLMLAVRQAHDDLVSILLNYTEVREGLDSKDDHGWTAVHYAADNKDPRSTRRLLTAGGDPSIRNNQGITAIDVAKSTHFGVFDLGSTPEHSKELEVQVGQLLEIEEIVRLVMLRTKCRQEKKYEEAELLRGELRVRGVKIDVQSDKWSLPDGKWGYLSADRVYAQVQQNNPIRQSTMT